MAGKKRIRIPDFQKELQKILDEYGDDVTEATKQAVQKVANIAKKETQAGANVRTGKYRSGWTVKQESLSRLHTEAIVYNRSRAQLAHLLEKGHALKRGGRTDGQTRAFPHIQPAEVHAIKNLEEAIKEIAEKG